MGEIRFSDGCISQGGVCAKISEIKAVAQLHDVGTEISPVYIEKPKPMSLNISFTSRSYKRFVRAFLYGWRAKGPFRKHALDRAMRFWGYRLYAKGW